MLQFIEHVWRPAVVAASVAAAPAQTVMASPDLAPHQAVYDLSLAEAAEDRGIVSAEGRLVISLDDVCDSWAVSERMVLRIVTADGARAVFDYRLSALEAKDGAAYRFTTSTLADGREVERREGRASTDESGARIVAFKTPEAPDLPLSDEVLFPTGQLTDLLETAAAGERAYQALLFDGVSDIAISLSTAAIAQVGEAHEPPEGMEDLRSWRVSAAHFDPDAPEGRPEYEVSFDFYENGVAARMRMVYDDFTLSANLAEVSIRPACAD